MINVFSVLYVIVFFLFSGLVHAQVVSDSYKWDNVLIGGGGYTVGVYVHPNNPDLIYTRTDMGGAYRWDKNLDRLVPVTDWIPYEQSNLYGVYGLALHPTNEDIVYLSLGKYLDRVSDIFKSTDQGNTWEAMNFESARFGANHTPNRKGNTLMLNPHKPDELWAGTLGAGLHKFSNDSWHKIATIPGDGVVRSIAFDNTDSNYIYVAVTYQTRSGLIGNRDTSGIYRSTDGGKSFELIPGFNREYDQFTDISLSKHGDKLYVSSREHDDKTGAVLLLNDAREGSQWKNISPESGLFRTVTASPHDNNTVMTARGTFGSLARFAVSTDSGSNWTFKSNYTVDNIVPWHPSPYPGSAISQIEFDPVNPKKVYFSDWYSVYYTEDWTLDRIHWTNDKARGHEQIVPAKILGAHPDNEAGAILYTGGADISGITQTKLDDYSTIPNWATLAGSPQLREVSGIDYCEKSPNTVVAMGGEGWTLKPGGVFVSQDGGLSFSPTNYVGGGGKVAVSARSKDNFVTIDNADTIRYTKNGGESFHNSSLNDSGFGISNVFSIVDPLASDRVNGKFYLYNRSTGHFFTSTDGGENFTKTGEIGVSNSNFINVKTVPGMADHIWVTNQVGLHYSTDGGVNWTKHQDFDVAKLMAVGKPQTSESYPALYVWGRKKGDDQVFFYRSTDGGIIFKNINLATTSAAGNDPMCMGADMSDFGRFYVGTNGRGVIYFYLDE